MIYAIRRNLEEFPQEFNSLALAQTAAEAMLTDVESNGDGLDAATFTIWHYDLLLDALTKRRIIGQYHREVWVDDNAEPAGVVDFDATDYVLGMTFSAFSSIQDNHDTSDCIGQDSVVWDGPCSVHVVTSICAFFGVESIDHISEVAFERVAKRYSLSDGIESTVNIPIKLNIRAAADFDLSTLANSLVLTARAEAKGVFILDLAVGDCSDLLAQAEGLTVAKLDNAIDSAMPSGPAELAEFSANAAIAELTANWKAALSEGASGSDLVGDVDEVIECLQRFKSACLDSASA